MCVRARVCGAVGGMGGGGYAHVRWIPTRTPARTHNPHTCAHAPICTQTHPHTGTCARMRAHARTHSHAHMQAHMITKARTQAHARINAPTLTHSHARTHTHYCILFWLGMGTSSAACDAECSRARAVRSVCDVLRTMCGSTAVPVACFAAGCMNRSAMRSHTATPIPPRLMCPPLRSEYSEYSAYSICCSHTRAHACSRAHARSHE